MNTETKKHCRGCGETKSTSEFSKNRSNKDGLQTQCKSCKSAYAKERYANDAEHRESVKACAKERYATDVEHREGMKARNKARHLDPVTRARSLVRNAVRDRGGDLAAGDCNIPPGGVDYCGFPIRCDVEGLTDVSPAIDRFYPGQPYGASHCGFVSQKTNTIKSDLTADELELAVVILRDALADPDAWRLRCKSLTPTTPRPNEQRRVNGKKTGKQAWMARLASTLTERNSKGLNGCPQSSYRWTAASLTEYLGPPPALFPRCSEPTAFNKGRSKKLRFSPEVDRVDPSLPYIPGNVIWLPRFVNACKSNFTLADVEQVAHGVRLMADDIEYNDAFIALLDAGWTEDAAVEFLESSWAPRRTVLQHQHQLKEAA